jgi:ubiquinone/menaquinone biosynthesis C-methylase UbiE
VGADEAISRDTVLHRARAYDLLVWVLTMGRERAFRDRLVELGRLGPDESVLDVGCGTGALAMAAKDRVGPGGQVCGLDPSPEMVARARRKAARAGVEVRFETVGVEALPFPDNTFDAVLSSLMLHHLAEEGRRQGIGEVARVLKPGGNFLAVDIGATNGNQRGLFHRVPRHAHFDLDGLTPVLDGAGLEIVDRGPIDSPRVLGLSNLRFILAVQNDRTRPTPGRGG